MKIKNISTVAVALFLLVAAGCKSSKSASTHIKARPVMVNEVQPRSISEFYSVTGGLEAGNDAVIYAKVPEILETIKVRTGAQVSKGEVIAVQKNVIQKQGVRLSEASLASAEARFAAVSVNFERMKRLLKEEGISQQQFDEIESQYLATEAAVKQAKAGLRQSREQFENTKIVSPFDGQLAAFNFEIGQMIPAGQPVARVVNTRRVVARVDVAENRMGQVKTGQRVFATFPSTGDCEFEGVVRDVDHAISATSRTFEVEIEFDNEDAVLVSGMFGRYDIELQHQENTIVLPDNVVLSQSRVSIDPESGRQLKDRSYYIFVEESSEARFRKVEVGIMGKGKIEIINGLDVGERVIIMGQTLVSDGASVRVIETNEAN